MKKLLIAMTAAAVGTCAWAEEVASGEGDSTPAAPTMLNESFGANWTLQAPWSYWSGAETAIPADGELTAGDALSLNTGSKVLRGNFMSDGTAKDIDTGLYFNATVTFKDPSDTLPTLGAGDKFALVVLDNIESVDAGLATVNKTNLYVIANHGVDGKRAYQLSPAEGIVDLTENWLNTPQTISVKSYKDVLAGDAIRAGLLVKVGNYVCKVFMSYKINENNVIDFTNGYTDGAADKTTAAGYLGYAASDIEGSVRLRYTNQELMLAMVTDTTLASVDFQGQGVIDNVSLATTGDGFGTDSLALTVVADGVTLVDTDETLYFAQIGDTVTIKFTVNDGFELSSPTGLTAVAGVYTYEYTTTANNEEVTISAFKPVVSVVVGDETKKYGSLSEAISKVAAGAELTLTDAITLTQTVAVDKNITINLNGKKLSAALSGTFTSMFRVNGNCTLTITDTANGVLEVTGGDRVLASSNRGAATVAIDKGTIDAACAVGTGQNTINYVITGGKFLKEANAEITPANGYEVKEENGYWVVAPASTSDYPESDKLVASDTELTDAQKEAVEATFDAIAGEAADADAAVTNYFTTVYGENVKVPVATITGAKNIDISVKFNLPLMTAETPTIEVAPATVTADSGNAVAFEFTIKDGDKALTLSQAAKVLEMVQYVAELGNTWAAATTEDVATSVNAGKAKVELKAKTGVNKGFMRLKLR